MPIFTNILEKFKAFSKPPKATDKEDFCKTHPAVPLVWNDDGVLLDTRAGDGTYSFEHFTGHIVRYKMECEVRDAAFIIHAGEMKFLAGAPYPQVPFGQVIFENNWICWYSGELLAGQLQCKSWKSGTVTGGSLTCKNFESGFVNGGKVFCSAWEVGTVNGGEICCGEWQCGTFNAGLLQGLYSREERPRYAEWKEGIFNGGTFQGIWFGGTWNGGTFKGKVRVGDGTFEWISAKKKTANIEE